MTRKEREELDALKAEVKVLRDMILVLVNRPLTTQVTVPPTVYRKPEDNWPYWPWPTVTWMSGQTAHTTTDEYRVINKGANAASR